MLVLKKIKLFIVFSPIICFKLFGDNGSVSLKIILQPFDKNKSEVLLNGRPLHFIVTYKDKSLAIAETRIQAFNWNSFGEQVKNKISVSYPEFRTKVFEIEADKRQLELFAVLDTRNSELEFQSMYKSDGTPKSVRFINDKTLVVTLLSGRGCNLIDLKTGKTRLLFPPEKYAQQHGFVESLVLEDRNELWISQMTNDCIHIFSLKDFAYLDTIKCSGFWGKVMAYLPSKREVYFTNWISKDISIVDTEKRIEKKRIALGTVPRGLVFSDDAQFVYFAQFEASDGTYGGKTVKLRLSDFKELSRFGKPGAKRHIVKDSKRKLLYVSDMSRCTVEVFSLIDERLLAEIHVAANPNTIVLAPDGKRLYVSCRGKNHPTKGYLHKGLDFGKIYVIDTKSFKLIEIIEGGNQATGLDISPDGKTLAFSDFLDNVVRVYSVKN